MIKCLLLTAVVLMARPALADPADARRSGAARDADSAVVAAATLPRTISFANRNWTVKASGGALWGPGPNNFSDDAKNVWVDGEGKLHLAITFEGGVWRCAEVILQNSLGYGSYRFTIDSPVDNLDPNVVLGLFTWNDSPAYNHRELDIEFSRWGSATDPTNAQYVVQPYTGSANLQRWTQQPGYAPSSHSFRWTSRSVVFQSSAFGNAYAQWSYTRRAGIPKPGGEQARINLWLFRGAPPANSQPVEVVIGKFEFLP